MVALVALVTASSTVIVVESYSNGNALVLVVDVVADSFFSAMAARFFLCVRFRRRPRFRLPSFVDSCSVVAVVVEVVVVVVVVAC